MKKHKLSVITSFIAILALLLFAGCKKEAPAPNVMDAHGVPGEDIAMFKVFANASTSEYKALSGSAKSIKTQTIGLETTVRVVLLHDVDSLVLRKLEFDAAANSFNSVETLFSISGKAGDVYEFQAMVSEGMPQARITADWDSYSASLDLQDGIDGPPNGMTVMGQSGI